MKRLFLLFSGLLLLALTACVNEKIHQEDLIKSKEITITAYPAEDNTPSTRVEYNYTSDDAPITLSWSDDDAFSVIRGGNNTTFSKSEAEGAGANDFTGSLPDGDGKYFAVYPTTAVTNHQSVPFDISDQSEALPYLMLASSETGNPFHFNHALAYLMVTFPESLKNSTATITITTPSGVYADGNLDLSNGAMSGGSVNVISKTVDFGENTDIMFALPPMAADNKTLIFTVKSGSKTYTATLAGNNSTAIEAGSYYTASVSLTEVVPCYLPNGETFNSTIKNYLSYYITSIVFVANSSNTAGTVINSGTSSTPAYASVENNSVLYIRTSAPEFVFDENCYRMFYGFQYVTTIDFGGCINTDNVTDMSYMFSGTSPVPGYTSLVLSDFNTANVTDMSNMFAGCQKLTSLDVSSFDTQNVKNMSYMFDYCKKLASLDVSNFNTSSVIDMSYMFNECIVLPSLDVSNFNTSSVTDMSYMFSSCKAVSSLDVSNFDTDEVTNMKYMFNGCEKVTSLELSNFNTASVTDMTNMFYSCAALTSLDVSKFNTEKVTSMKSMFDNCCLLSSIDVSKFNTASVTDMSNMFYRCYAVTSLDVSKFNTEKVTNMSCMFKQCYVVATLDVSKFNTEKVTNMKEMFYQCKALQQLDVSEFNTAKVTDMSSMFWDCKLLASLDVSSFDTKKVTTMYGMFYGCKALESVTFSANFNTKEVTTMNMMFAYCNNLVSLDLSSFDTGEVTNMAGMFNACYALESITFGSNFNTAKVTTMEQMFNQNRALTSLDLSGFNTGKVTNMKQMFNGAMSLTSIDLCNFTFNATYTNMFLNSALTSICVKTSEDVTKLKNGGCGKNTALKVCDTHNS